MRVEVVSRRPVEGGVVAACPVGGASGDVHGFTVDLGTANISPSVVFTAWDSADSGAERLTLDDGETEVLDILATAYGSTDLVEWRLLVDFVIGDKEESVTIDDNGNPFRTAGTSGLPMFEWQGEGWHPYSP